MTWGLVFLDFQIFENWSFWTIKISEKSLEIRTFIAFLRYNFAKFFLKSNIFLNEFWFSLKFLKFFMFQKFSAPSTPKIGLFGRFLPKILVFLDLKVTAIFWQVTLPYSSPNIYIIPHISLNSVIDWNHVKKPII